MQRQKNLLLGLIFAGAACLALAPGEAQAKFALITAGDAVSELGEITAEMRTTFELPAEFKVGYKYSYAGVFWLDIWTWDGEFCVYKGGGFTDDTAYEPIDKALAAQLIGKKEDEISVPFVYRFPLLLLILGSVAGIGVLVFVVSLVTGKKPDPEASPSAPPPPTDPEPPPPAE